MLREETQRLGVDGKFFTIDGERCFLRLVSYGPFPDGAIDHCEELKRVAASGWDGIRVYDAPSEELLDAALEYGLIVLVGLSWEWERVFLGSGGSGFWENTKREVLDQLAQWGGHAAVAGCFVANEIRSDIARWVGVEQARAGIEEIIELVKVAEPRLLVAYASYPSSEYLEPRNADFTAMNIYLEDEGAYRGYLKRLHHIAGDRPVLVSEFGGDSLSLGEEGQREILAWGLSGAQHEGMAGWTCFSWSDLWLNGGALVEDWAFGLVRAKGEEKPAYSVLEAASAFDFPMPMVSVIICVYNGVGRIGAAIASLENLNYPKYEVIVVDDGSTDGTRELLAECDGVRVVEAAHGGLSVARNLGAEAARGEILSYIDDDCEVDADYLFWLAKGYSRGEWAACGGPNIPPPPMGEDEAVVISAPGAPSHVMIDDVEAEHIPGCHLSVSRAAFDAIGGFRAQYRTAGDDVDFCWRLRAAGFKIGFHGASFVWHRRRTTVGRYLKQQWGYGRAEALLIKDHPEKFGAHGIRWEGSVYVGAASGVTDGTVIYHGPSGGAAYQMFWARVMPSRLLDRRFRDIRARLKLGLAEVMQPWLRAAARMHYAGQWGRLFRRFSGKTKKEKEGGVREFYVDAKRRAKCVELLRNEGWLDCGDYEGWDLERAGSRLLVVEEWWGEGKSFCRIRLSSELKHAFTLEREVQAICLRGR
ncbi:glycosyltransferase [Rubritalea tangerina]|uniref:glycosyltransferase n=1 Tax=Rubritalea tangerina TaxID=430798 RepID=UPI00360B4E15